MCAGCPLGGWVVPGSPSKPSSYFFTDSSVRCLEGEVELNSYCVLEVLKYLSVAELAIVAQVNTTLMHLAASAFQQYHRSSINFIYSLNDFQQQRMVLEQFGNIAVAISAEIPIYDIAVDRTSHMILRDIARFCGDNLQCLTSNGFQLSLGICLSDEFSAHDLVNTNQHNAAESGGNVIDNCVLDDADLLMVPRFSLKKLRIVNSDIYENPFMTRFFPKLQEAIYTYLHKRWIFR